MAKGSPKLQFTNDELAQSIKNTVHRTSEEDENQDTDPGEEIPKKAASAVSLIETAHRTNKAKDKKEESRSKNKTQQKSGIKKEYAKAKTPNSSSETFTSKEAVPRRSREPSDRIQRIRSYLKNHKRSVFILCLLGFLLLVTTSSFSSCSLLFQGITSSISSSTYPSEDSDMLSAEDRYCAMEEELQEKLDNYSSTHDYDEYIFELDDIYHDPYVLISALTALKGGAWTVDEVEDELALLFEKQYILTETVSTSTRYRTERRTGTREVVDPHTGEVSYVEYTYNVSVPYTHKSVTVKLENFNLSHVPIYIMTEDQLSMYSVYMATLGNRPDLFEHSDYLDRYYNGNYEDYDIPSEALEDEEFKAIITEAEKYLGYPYVWGGSSPSTSFDCSGFVSWVINHSGWNVGRLSAEGLRQICSRVPPSSAQPGDLIFFEKTYNTYGASHVGIYVGNNMMIHCGDPIHYSSISTSYWQQHFLSFGRLP